MRSRSHSARNSYTAPRDLTEPSRFKNTVQLDSIIARSQHSKEFCNTFPLITDIARRGWHGRKVPMADSSTEHSGSIDTRIWRTSFRHRSYPRGLQCNQGQCGCDDIERRCHGKYGGPASRCGSEHVGQRDQQSGHSLGRIEHTIIHRCEFPAIDVGTRRGEQRKNLTPGEEHQPDNSTNNIGLFAHRTSA